MFSDRLEQFMVTLFGIIAIVFLAWLVMTVTAYVLKGIALSRMAGNAGHPSPFLAWIPVANNYLLGCLCEQSMYCRTGKAWKFSVILPVLDLVSIFGGSVLSPLYSAMVGSLYYSDYYDIFGGDLPAVGGGLVGLAITVVTAIALYNLFWNYNQGRETLYTVLSVIFGGLGQAIILFVLRDRVPVSAQGGGWGQPYPGGYPQGPYPGSPYTTGPEQSSYQGQPPYQTPGEPYTTQWSQPPQHPQYPQYPQYPQNPQDPQGPEDKQ